MRGILRPLPSKETHRETIEKIHEVSRERTYGYGRLRELVKWELVQPTQNSHGQLCCTNLAVTGSSGGVGTPYDGGWQYKEGLSGLPTHGLGTNGLGGTFNGNLV